MFLLHKIYFDIKQSKVEQESPRAPKSNLTDPEIGCSSSNFDGFVAKSILRSKNNDKLFLLHKILFAIQWLKFELKHTNLGSFRMFLDALGCSSSTFNHLIAKIILCCKNLIGLQRLKFELKHPYLGLFRMLQDALGCSSSSFDRFIAKRIL